MEPLIGSGAEVLRLVPLILAFYVPALLGVILLKERGESYKVKATLVFIVGFGAIVALQLLIGGISTPQVAETIGLSLLEIAAALFLASLTVYRLAD